MNVGSMFLLPKNYILCLPSFIHRCEQKMQPFIRTRIIKIDLNNQTMIQEGNLKAWVYETETWEGIAKELFDSVKNPDNWKLPTKTKTVGTLIEAEMMADAISNFTGGATIKPIVKDFEVIGYKISSRGYYHHIGA